MIFREVTWECNLWSLWIFRHCWKIKSHTYAAIDVKLPNMVTSFAPDTISFYVDFCSVKMEAHEEFYYHKLWVCRHFIFMRIRKIAKRYYYLCDVCPSVSLSVRKEKLDIFTLFENPSTKFKFYLNLTGITGTLRDDVFTFLTKSRWILLKMRNV